MSDYKDVMAAAAVPFAAQIHRYRILAAQGVGVHLFLEGGYDKLLYPAIVRNLTEVDVYTYEMDGYDGVLRAYDEIIAMDLRHKLTMYFVDRDLSDYIPDRRLGLKGLFCTSGYSVESYLFDSRVPDIVAVELDNAPPGHIVTGSWMKVKAELPRFVSAMRILTSYVLSAKEAGASLNLNNLRLENMHLISDTASLKIGGKFLSKACGRVGIVPDGLDRCRVRYWRARLDRTRSPVLA